MKLRLLGALALAVMTGCGAVPLSQARGGVALAAASQDGTGSFTRGTFSGYTYKLFLPANFKRFEPAPLAVMLHGCTQTADDFAAVTRMNDIAQKEGFAVLYPEQRKEDHNRLCWRWFDPAHIARGQGEAGVIEGMIREVTGKYGIDKSRTYVAGLSAGGCMANVMAALYPDMFAAAGAASGLEAFAATDETNAWKAMAGGGPDPDPIAAQIVSTWGDKPVRMPVMVFHGVADALVNVKNGSQIARQWVKVNDLALRKLGGGSVPDQPAGSIGGETPGGYRFMRKTWQDSAGRPVVEHYDVEKLAHAWSGGPAGLLFADPKGPDASRLLWAFLKGNRR
jgi:poly(hydroxyalkanoate) depolymerase family esterase